MGNSLAGKSVLVTGGTGSIGNEIVRLTLENGASNVVTFGRDEIKCFQIRNKNIEPRLQAVVGDIRDYKTIERAFDRFNFDIIYHCAAMKHIVVCEDLPYEAVKTNVLGTQNIIDLALRHNVTHLTTISTDKAVNPTSVMGATKLIAERITLNANKTFRSKCRFSCVRFGNVANSRGSVIPVFVDKLLSGLPLQVTDPEVTRFIIGISEAAKLVVKANSIAQGGEIFILKMKAFKLGDLVEVLTNRIAPKINVPKSRIRVDYIGLVQGEKQHEQLITDVEEPRTYDSDDMYIVLPDNNVCSNYKGLNKISLPRFTSRDVEMLSGVDIERLILEYLEKRHLLLRFEP